MPPMIELLTAEFGIRQLQARYIDATWRKDGPAFAACWEEDAQWQIAGMHMRGRAEIAAAFDRLINLSHKVLMRIGTPTLDIGQGTATGRLYVTEYVKKLDGGSGTNIGIYHDRYAGEGVNWRFKSRLWNLVYKGPPDFSEAFLDCPDHGPPPAMPSFDQTPD